MKKPITSNDVLENIVIPLKDDPRLPKIMELVTRLYIENGQREWFILEKNLSQEFNDYLKEYKERSNKWLGEVDI